MKLIVINWGVNGPNFWIQLSMYQTRKIITPTLNGKKAAYLQSHSFSLIHQISEAAIQPTVRECLTGGFLRAVSHEAFVPLQAEQQAAPRAEVTVWGRLGSPLVNILFRTKLLSLVPLSWDMDCVLTLWLTLPLVPLVTVAIHLVFWSLSFPKEVSCTAAYIYS